MKLHNKLLDLIAQGSSKIMVFDCEFWHVFSEDSGYMYVPDQPFFFIPREIGGFLLNKQTDGSWKYNGTFFVTMSKPSNDVAFPISHFATVSAETAKQLDQLEFQLDTPWGEAYYSALDSRERPIWKKGVDLYENDPNIKSHHKSPSWIKTFLKQYSESTIVVKGTADIESLQNACNRYNISYTPPGKIVDIADWNLTSRKKCGTAKLEGTYKCIKHKLDPDTKKLLDILPLQKAHDPSTDASMTLIVAMYILSLRYSAV